MQKNITLKLLPSEASNDAIIKKYIAESVGTKLTSIAGYHVLKQSLDARARQPWISLSVMAFIDEPFHEREQMHFNFRDVKDARNRVIIVGAGPAGLFAALQLIEKGIQPIIIERGKDVKARRRDLAILNRSGKLNPESNYCFGEGGAGTYSDGKLYTRSSKRGDINRILHLFVHFGADEKILYEAHPHIGTNKLPQIITAMRGRIIECGGEIWFEKKLTDLQLSKGRISSVVANGAESFTGDAVILATGHSARDIYELLENRGIPIEFKPFALGVRIEHPQALIDSVQYHGNPAPELPPASYNLVHQVNGKGVFSFCMCPGGIIAPAATDEGELVVNGWSPSRRNNPYANSGIVVPVEENDLSAFRNHGVLAGLFFQRSVEQKAFAAGGGKFVAPAQRLIDFIENKTSTTLPDCSYLPGIRSADLKVVLPTFIHRILQTGFKEFGKKMRGGYGASGFLTNEAVVVATESRTSSPVRIPRDPVTLQHTAIANFYPCGEGAGYAGGIVSAAMDGERVACSIAEVLRQ